MHRLLDIIFRTLVILGALAAVAIAALFAFMWHESRPRVSDDIAALRAMVNIPANATSARWEVLDGASDGFAVGPVDVITMVAELTSQDGVWPQAETAANGKIWVASDAARPWLSDDFRTLLEKYKDLDRNIATEPGCHAYQTTVTKSGRVIDGFICERGRRALLFLTLQADT